MSAHTAAAVEAVRDLLEGRGEKCLLIAPEQPNLSYYAGLHRKDAAYLIEAILTFTWDEAYGQILLFAGSGRHFPNFGGITYPAVLAVRGGETQPAKTSEPERRDTEDPLGYLPSHRPRARRIGQLKQIEIASEMLWPERILKLLDRIEGCCGWEWREGTLRPKQGDGIGGRTLALIDAEYLCPRRNRDTFHMDLPQQNNLAQMIERRFEGLPALCKAGAVDAILFCPSHAIAASLIGKRFPASELGDSAPAFPVLAWPDAKVVSWPTADPDGSLGEFFPRQPRKTGLYSFLRSATPSDPVWPPQLRLDTAGAADELAGGLRSEIVGQDAVLNLLARRVTRQWNRKGPRKEPIVTALLLGPGGCGKTETTLALARALFGRNWQRHLHEINFNEAPPGESITFYMFGPPPGYQGSSPTAGNLIRPFVTDPAITHIIVINEIEKASGPEATNALFELLDRGEAPNNATGERLNCRNSLILATSNIASREISDYIRTRPPLEEARTRCLDIMLQSGVRGWTQPFLRRWQLVLPYRYPEPPELKEVLRKQIPRRALNSGNAIRVRDISDIFLDSILARDPQLIRGVKGLIEAADEVLEDSYEDLPAGSVVSIDDNGALQVVSP